MFENVEPIFESVIVDDEHFPMLNGLGVRCVLLTESLLEALVIGIKEAFGSGGLALVYHQGVVIGRNAARRYMEAFRIESLREGLKIMLKLSLVLGRFKGEIEKFKVRGVAGDEIILKLYNNWECMIARKYGVEGPASNFERGVIAGFIEGFTNRRVLTHEVKCIASNDPYCQFNIKIIT